MTHQSFEHVREPMTDILTADEASPSFARQAMNGIGGLLVLMIVGIAVVLVVLWKSP